MKEYHKIQTVFLRDPATKHRTVLEGQFAKPEFEYLKDNIWVLTEKVDGTNIRVHWDGETVRFGGRTDNAQIPTFLLNTLQDLFPAHLFQETELPPLCLYGEGYGAKIQKGGGNYIPDGCNFILFDVNIGEVWLERGNVEDIADKLSIRPVPIIGRASLLSAIDMAKNGFPSVLRETPPEGLVMKPEVDMFNRRGERIVAKIKLRDFQQ